MRPSRRKTAAAADTAAVAAAKPIAGNNPKFGGRKVAPFSHLRNKHHEYQCASDQKRRYQLGFTHRVRHIPHRGHRSPLLLQLASLLHRTDPLLGYLEPRHRNGLPPAPDTSV